MKHLFTYFFLPVVFLCALLLVPAIGIYHEFYCEGSGIVSSSAPVYELSEHWQYQWGAPGENTVSDVDWKPINNPINPPGRRNNTLLWLRYRLPTTAVTDGTLFIGGKGVLLTFETFLDDQLIYKFGKLTAMGEGKFSGISSHLIHLGDDYRGKMVTFKVFSDYANIGIRGKVVYGSRSALLENIIKNDFSRFIIGLFLILIGVLDLLVYRTNFGRVGSVSMFGILAVSMGLYTTNLTALKDLIFHAPVFWFNVYIVAMSLIPVGATGFVWQTFRPVKGNIFHRIWQFQLGYACICQVIFLLILHSFLPMTVGSWTLNILRLLLLVQMGLITGVCMVDFFIKKEKLVGIYLCGFVPIILCGVHDALVGLGKLESSSSFVPLALLVFILTLECIKRLQNIEIHNTLEIYARQLEKRSNEKIELLKDLHDGLGGLVTNIKFLSQMGLNNPSEEGMRQSLISVSELSNDCMVEIGSFMQSLDENEADWLVLAQTLSHIGEKMLTPLGLSFVFRKNVDETMPEPDGFLFLNILKIFKEALANIIKHAEAEHVDAEFHVTEEKAVMVIQDDGQGFGDDIVKGHGLANMRTRAAKIGGSLLIESKAGTCVTLLFKP
ncbi:sensor histidine kinase [Desulfomarina profundi]|uniref:sensor histidine kinase n=1 Tax=Desulfomarina profundi TaxID=2772557 RepID=UPI001E2D02DA|nr:ATP-binding protein [Desulfomarina profundi]